MTLQLGLGHNLYFIITNCGQNCPQLVANDPNTGKNCQVGLLEHVLGNSLHIVIYRLIFCLNKAIWRGLSTSIHYSAPRGLKSTYWFLYTNLKNTPSNFSYLYIDHKTCTKINIYNCYVHARSWLVPSATNSPD